MHIRPRARPLVAARAREACGRRAPCCSPRSRCWSGCCRCARPARRRGARGPGRSPTPRAPAGWSGEPRLAFADDLIVRLDGCSPPASICCACAAPPPPSGGAGASGGCGAPTPICTAAPAGGAAAGAGAGAVISATSEKRLSVALNSADSAASEARSDEPSASASNASRILRLVARARSRVSDDTASIRCAGVGVAPASSPAWRGRRRPSRSPSGRAGSPF